MEFVRELSFQFPLLRGEDVRVVQQGLTVAQSVPPCGTVDGIFAAATRDAVIGFQGREGIATDGVVGPRTWAALFRRATDAGASSVLLRMTTQQLPSGDLPVTQAQAVRVSTWLSSHFGDRIRTAIAGTPIDAGTVCAIACKETAPIWLSWIGRLPAEQVLARCVFDGSGDVPGTSRGAFPQNTALFRARYGDAVAADLVAEANETRRLRGYGPETWVYKGYGIFQYDLQNIESDPDFFRKKLWRSFDACMDRLMRELNEKLKAANGDLRDAVRRYNGQGPRAEQYATQVLAIRAWLTDGTISQAA